ncbi:MAG: hypothetical protein MZV64_06220 [Ignavibacteriales bacterium]|nr:hypothetical protein [Ignavibacteriales bacterium]
MLIYLILQITFHYKIVSSYLIGKHLFVSKHLTLSLFAALLFIAFQESAEAQFYFFEVNKVQYEKIDWKVLKTEHFDIYYYNETEQLAEIGGHFAEEIYSELLKVRLNHILTRRVPLIFYNTHIHFQQTNTTLWFIPEGVGGFFEFIKGREVIPSTGSLNDLGMSFVMNWFMFL